MSARLFLRTFATYLRPQWRRAVMLMVALLLSIALKLAAPLFVKAFIDGATAVKPIGYLTTIAVTFVAVALGGQAIAVLAVYLGESVGWTATNLLRADLVNHSLHLDSGFHHEVTPGELIERIDGDVTALTIFFSQFLINLGANLLLMAGAMVLLFREDPRLGMAFAAFCAVLLAVLYRVAAVSVPKVAQERQALAELMGFLEERLGGLDDLRANGGGSWTMRGFHERSQHWATAVTRAQRATSYIWTATNGLFALGFLVALGLGAWLNLRGAVGLGTVFLAFQYVEMLRRPLDQLSHQLRESQRAFAGLGRVTALLSRSPTIVDGPGAALPAGPLPLAFEDVTFRYPTHAGSEADDAPVLSGVSFALRPGETLGVVGRTGSGKTTLARLLFRLYDVSSGTVRLGGTDVRNLTLWELRRRVGMVTQDVQVFQASVRDNLTFFDDGIDEQQILDTLEQIGLGPWLAALPEGLQTELSGDGGLSAGEAQLVALARVFLRDPGLVILDEASSRLDPATERLVEAAVERLLAGRTAIIIAHRLATLRRVDSILVLDHGRVAELGPRAVLAARDKTRFAAMLRFGLENPEYANAELEARNADQQYESRPVYSI